LVAGGVQHPAGALVAAVGLVEDLQKMTRGLLRPIGGFAGGVPEGASSAADPAWGRTRCWLRNRQRAMSTSRTASPLPGPNRKQANRAHRHPLAHETASACAAVEQAPGLRDGARRLNGPWPLAAVGSASAAGRVRQFSGYLREPVQHF